MAGYWCCVGAGFGAGRTSGDREGCAASRSHCVVLLGLHFANWLNLCSAALSCSSCGSCGSCDSCCLWQLWQLLLQLLLNTACYVAVAACGSCCNCPCDMSMCSCCSSLGWHSYVTGCCAAAARSHILCLDLLQLLHIVTGMRCTWCILS